MQNSRVFVRQGVGFPSETSTSNHVACSIENDTTVKNVLLQLSLPLGMVERGALRLVGSQSHKYLYPSVPIVEQFEARRISDRYFDIIPILCGGGGDGGSTGAEDRAAYLAMYAGKKPDKVDPVEQRLALFTTCRLSGEPLRTPCVCDDLGSLYNKDAVLTALISKTVPKSLAHITSRKSVHDAVLYPVDSADLRVQYGCPITGLSLNGRYRFVALKASDGVWHVVSEKAVKELPVVVQGKLGCPVPSKKDQLPIYPQGDELDALLDKVIRKHQEELVEKAAKKAKREKKKKRERDDVQDTQVKTKKLDNMASIPQGATPAVWKSLFVDKKNSVPEGDAGYMTRGVRKYI